MGVRTLLGTMACLCCGHEIPVKQSEGGALGVGCPYCDLSAYAKQGTLAYRQIMGKVKRPEPDPPAPAAAAARPAPAKPADAVAPAAPVPAKKKAGVLW